jgi:hypothetical protein
MPSARSSPRPPSATASAETTRSAWLWFAGAIAVVLAFKATGLDDRWLDLLVASIFTSGLVWMRYQVARGTFVDIPPDLKGDAAAEFRLGVTDGADVVIRFLALHVAWYWTKGFGIPIEWSASGMAVVSLVAAVWCHLRIVNGVDDVPAAFANAHVVYAGMMEKTRRLERKFYFGSFALYAAVGVMTWFLD